MSTNGKDGLDAADGAAAIPLRRRWARSLAVIEIRARLLVLCCGALANAGAPALAAQTSTDVAQPLAQPRSQGFSPERLQRLDHFLEDATDENGYLGAVTLIARHGKIVEARAFGHRDFERRAPMQTDSIFRIYSMTKTITTVAALILMEEGKLTLDDPVGKYLPEFSSMQVLAGGTADKPELRAAARKLTIHHLLTHTAGFATRGGDAERAAHTLLDRADLHDSASLKDYAERVSRAPLAVDPGTRFNYDGVQIEVLSRLIEVVAGMPFETFVQQRILDPLKMADTGFSVPPEKRGRIADITKMGDDGKLVRTKGQSAAAPGERQHAYPSGAGGLYSTAADYARFCQMLLDGGELDGASILGRKTVESMMQNHLTMLEKPVTEFTDADGFGLGGSVLIDPARRGRLGSPGQFGWSGAASTYYTIDPQEQLIAILLMQHLPREDMHDLPRISANFYNLVYQALTR